MSDRQALIEAIRDNPDEDTPRLFLADWYEGKTASPRAASSFECSAISPGLIRPHPNYHELHVRQLQILAEYEAEWLGEWTRPARSLGISSGMLEAITVEPGPFLLAAELFAQHPLDTVAFVNEEGESLAASDICRVVGAPHFARIRSLELSGCRAGEHMFGMFGGSVDTSAWLGALANATHATRLESVALRVERALAGAIEARTARWLLPRPRISPRCADSIYPTATWATTRVNCRRCWCFSARLGLRAICTRSTSLGCGSRMTRSPSSLTHPRCGASLSSTSAGATYIREGGLRRFLGSRPLGCLTDSRFLTPYH